MHIDRLESGRPFPRDQLGWGWHWPQLLRAALLASLMGGMLLALTLSPPPPSDQFAQISE